MPEWEVCAPKGLSRLAVTIAVVAALLCGFAGAAFAQLATGTITGTVTDPKGVAIAGVAIAVLNTDTGVEIPARSNVAGIYNIPALPPGNYQLTATQKGFATVQNKEIRVQVGETLRLNMEMQVAKQPPVTATAAVPLLETEKTEQSQTVTGAMLGDLPLSSGRWEQFVPFTPGVAPDGSDDNAAFHGLSSMYNNNSVDGANNNNAYYSTTRGDATSSSSGDDGYAYSADAIREVQVVSNNYDAELGQAAGGQINAVTKSGTNAMHGNLYENFRYPSLDALDPSTTVNATTNGLIPTQTVHQQNQFGGSLGGPLRKDKLFVFLNYDGYRKITPIAYTTAAGIGGSVPISQLTCPVVAGFKSNPGLIAQGTMNADCAEALNWVTTQDLGTFSRELTQNVGFGRIDYQFNPANHLNVAFDWRDWTEPSDAAFASSQNSGLAATGNSYIQDRFLTANWTAVMGNGKVNEARYQFGQDNSFQTWQSPPPSVAVSNLFAYGQNNADPQNIYETRNQFSDSYSFTRGRHSFKLGADLNYIRDDSHISIDGSGAYNYSSPVVLPSGPTGTGAKTCAAPNPASAAEETLYCDWILDLYGINVGDGETGRHWTTFDQMKDERYLGDALSTNGAGTATLQNSDYAGYFQDTWKWRPSVTVNAGLRYDISLYSAAPNANTRTSLLSEYTSSVPPSDDGGIQPRVGAAWSMDKNTVLRVGFGTFFSKISNSAISSAQLTSGTAEQLFNCTTTSTTCNGAVVGGGPIEVLRFPDVFFAQQAQAPAAPFFGTPQPLTPLVINPPGNLCSGNLSCAVQGFSPDAVRPRVYEGDLTLERQLPWKIGFSASYLITRGTHLPINYDANLAPTAVSKNYDVVDANGNIAEEISEPFYTERLDTTTGPILSEFSVVNSWYNAFVLTVRRSALRGVDIVANYTYAKSTDDGEAGGVSSSGAFLGGETPADPYNIKGEYAPSNIDVRSRLTASVVWTPLSSKKFSRKSENAILNGLVFSSIITLSSGEPYSGEIQSTAPPCSVATSIPSGESCSSVDGVSGEDGGVTGSALSLSGASAGGRLDWLTRNSFYLPGYSNVDLRATKQFTFHERYNLELRAEAFNVFNAYILQGVNMYAYTFAQSGAAGCPASNHNTCLVPLPSFQTPTTTSGFLLGARQMQLAIRLNF